MQLLFPLLLTVHALEESGVGIAAWKPHKYTFIGKGCLRGDYNTYTGEAGKSANECSRKCHVNEIKGKLCGFFSLYNGKCFTGTSSSTNGAKKDVFDIHPCGFLMPDEDVYAYEGDYNPKQVPCKCLSDDGCGNGKDYCAVDLYAVCDDKTWKWWEFSYTSKSAKRKCVAKAASVAAALAMKTSTPTTQDQPSAVVQVFALLGLGSVLYGAARFYLTK